MIQRILGLDIGIASIGWALVEYDKENLNNNKIIKSGVRIFTIAENPKTGEPLALPRRLARGARRTNKRKRKRLENIKKLFIKYLNISKEEIFSPINVFNEKKLIDVWQLRDKALKRKLSNYEFARVLTHIAKRRGYKSNRKIQEKGNSQGKKVLSAIDENKKLLTTYLTIGQAIYQKTKDTKIRRNKKDDYNHSISRDMLLEEIDTIFTKQFEFKNNLANNNFKEKYIELFAKQIDFSSVDDMVGTCTLEGNSEKRAPKRAYSSEEFVTLTKLINTKLIDDNGEEKYFKEDELKKIINLCKMSEQPTYVNIRKIINLNDNVKFKSLDYFKLDEKKQTGEFLDPEKEKFKSAFIGFHKLRKVIEKSLSKLHWQNISNNKILLNEIALIFSYHKNDTKIKEELEKLDFKTFTKEEKSIIINDLILNIHFDKFIHLSIKAIDKLLVHMNKGIRYDEAVSLCRYKNKIENKNIFLRALNFDENKEMTNPVVKRSIAQLRKVVNSIIREYGQFDKVHIELTREIKKSHQDRNKIKKGQEEFQNIKQNIVNKFIEDYKREPRGNELLKFRLLEEQKYQCVYSMKNISPERLLETGYVEIDHILPFSKSLEDGIFNKVLCLSKENQDKKNRTPYEYFTQTNKNWHKFEIFVKSLHFKKAKYTRLLKKNFDENSQKEFRLRNINDTAYMSKFIKNFIENNLELKSKQKVVSINGTLTNMLRHNWGIGNKSRDTHLHHAVDAIIIAFATNSEVNRLSELSAKIADFRYKKSEQKANLLKFVSPLEKMRNEVQKSIDDIFVSFAPRKSVRGAVHKETIYSKNLKKKKGSFEVNGGLAENGEVKRVDVFKKDSKYHFILLYVNDFEKDMLPTKTIKNIQIDNSYNFIFSIFKNEFIEIKQKNKPKVNGYFKFCSADGRFAICKHIDAKFNATNNRFSTGSLEYIKKYQVDALGNKNEIKKEPRIGTKKQNKKSK